MNLYSVNMDRIMAEYGNRSLQNLLLQEKHKEEIYDKLPEIDRIDKEIKSLAIDAARKRITDPANAPDAETIKRKTEELTASKKKILTENGYPADYMDRVYTCGICKDTGYIDGRMCTCLRNTITAELYKNSNLINVLNVENFQNFSFDYFSKNVPENEKISPYDNIQRVVNAAKSFTEEFDTGSKGSNILLFGPIGLGKTYLCNCIAKELLDNGHEVLYVSSNELFELYSEYVRNRKDERISGLYKRLFSSELLIIDDLGTESINSFVQSSFFEVINQRLVRKNSTIISTNLDPNELKSRYTERTVSRILGNYKVLRFFGRNIRYSKLGI
ncbi:MAG: ATP-binding protein [Eubacterium sp.]|nr:ATP-binding protein [Eubacterium sp.]